MCWAWAGSRVSPNGAVVGDRVRDRLVHAGRFDHLVPADPAGLRDRGELHGVQVVAHLGVAQQGVLLPDLEGQRVVAQDDDRDREVVLRQRCEFAHPHREGAVADEGDDGAVGVGDLCADRVRQR
jgi:hypothetical protein